MPHASVLCPHCRHYSACSSDCNILAIRSVQLMSSITSESSSDMEQSWVGLFLMCTGSLVSLALIPAESCIIRKSYRPSLLLCSRKRLVLYDGIFKLLKLEQWSAGTDWTRLRPVPVGIQEAAFDQDCTAGSLGQCIRGSR